MLTIPLKTSTPVALDEHLRTHIDKNYADADPNAFTDDYARLAKLRNAVISAEAHPALLRELVVYYAQLVFLASKFPDDIGADFSWQPAFTSASVGGILSGSLPSQQPIVLGSLPFERANVLFNIASMNATLGASESDVKRSIAYFQTAAGVFEHLRDQPQIKTPLGTPEPCSPDLYASSLQALQFLCLAQAQECAWQKAVADRLRNGTIAKLAAQTSEYYSQALEHANAAKSAGGAWPAFSFPSAFIGHITVKKLHFVAAAQYRRSIDDLAANKYGEEIGRLRLAEATVKKGLETPKRGVAASLFDDLKVR